MILNPPPPVAHCSVFSSADEDRILVLVVRRGRAGRGKWLGGNGRAIFEPGKRSVLTSRSHRTLRVGVPFDFFHFHGCRSLKIIGEGWQRISERWEGTGKQVCRQYKVSCDLMPCLNTTYMLKKYVFHRSPKHHFCMFAVFPGHTWKPENHPSITSQIEYEY